MAGTLAGRSALDGLLCLTVNGLSESMLAVLAAVAAAARVNAAPPPRSVQPRWDPATLPVAFHSSNSTGNWDAEQIKQLARFAMVTVEKWQNIERYVPPDTLAAPSYADAGGLYNCQSGADLSRCGCCAEDDIVSALRKVKAVNPAVVTVAYLHSDIVQGWYRAAQHLAAESDCWLRDRNGTLMPSWHGVHGCGNSGNCTWLLLDHSKPACSELFAESCLAMTRTGAVDGCFVDGCNPAGSLPAGPTPEQGRAMVAGKLAMLAKLQTQVAGPLICGSTGAASPSCRGVQAEGWGVETKRGFMFAQREIPMLMAAMDAGVLFQAHGRAVCEHAGDPYHPAVQTELAAFLVGMGPQAFYLCGAWEQCTTNPPLRPGRCAPNANQTLWWPVYDMTLGEPLANASKIDSVWHREFASGTKVVFDTTTNTGKITWAAAQEKLPNTER